MLSFKFKPIIVSRLKIEGQCNSLCTQAGTDKPKVFNTFFWVSLDKLQANLTRSIIRAAFPPDAEIRACCDLYNLGKLEFTFLVRVCSGIGKRNRRYIERYTMCSIIIFNFIKKLTTKNIFPNGGALARH